MQILVNCTILFFMELIFKFLSVGLEGKSLLNLAKASISESIFLSVFEEEGGTLL